MPAAAAKAGALTERMTRSCGSELRRIGARADGNGAHAVALDESQASVAEGLQRSASRDARKLATCLGEAVAQEPPDRADAEYARFHFAHYILLRATLSSTEDLRLLARHEDVQTLALGEICLCRFIPRILAGPPRHER